MAKFFTALYMKTAGQQHYLSLPYDPKNKQQFPRPIERKGEGEWNVHVCFPIIITIDTVSSKSVSSGNKYIYLLTIFQDTAINKS